MERSGKVKDPVVPEDNWGTYKGERKNLIGPWCSDSSLKWIEK